MLAKSWKQILLVILIIACIWNIISKFANASTFSKEAERYQAKQEQNANKIRENKN